MTLAPNSEPQERARSMPEAKWYIVHAYSNFEKKVAATIREQAERKGLTHLIEEIEVPTEEVVEVARGKKKTVEKRYFPGYVLMKAQLTDDIYHLVKDTPKVSGFLGAEGGKKPLPVRQREVDRILGKSTDTAAERPRPKVSFEIGEQVQVNDGPFQGFEGAVEEIDEAHGRLKVTVSIFGRGTPVDLEFDQVVKV
jgi:transcriptional antiterminator NusG